MPLLASISLHILTITRSSFIAKERAASSSKLARWVRGQRHFLLGGGGGAWKTPTSMSRASEGGNRGRRPPRPHSARFRHLSPQKCESCSAFSSPASRSSSVSAFHSLGRGGRDENLPLATASAAGSAVASAAVGHSTTYDVSTREKSNVTSGAEGTTTDRQRNGRR